MGTHTKAVFVCMCKRGHSKDKRDTNNGSGAVCLDHSESYTATLYVCLTAEPEHPSECACLVLLFLHKCLRMFEHIF